ncbi:hypothetical protein MNEG_12507, partial [Monoraphidium neglectum]
MDEVRLWKVKRSQSDIIRSMRLASGLENHADLVAYWKFDEPDKDGGEFRAHVVAKDSSGKGNDLHLATPPQRGDVEIKPAANSLRTGRLEFKNNLALNKQTKGMPEKSFTDVYSQMFSYAAPRGDDPAAGPDFADDAIRIERYLENFLLTGGTFGSDHSTAGAVSVHINSNENTDSTHAENWIDFDAGWVDDKWHHVAVTWDHEDGTTRLYLDGEQKTAFWKSECVRWGGGMVGVWPRKTGGGGARVIGLRGGRRGTAGRRGAVDDKPAKEGGVDPKVAAKTTRRGDGALALGQDQDCLGGCFSPANAFDGELAVPVPPRLNPNPNLIPDPIPPYAPRQLRVWGRVLTQDDVRRNMWRNRPDNEEGLAALYVFDTEGVKAVGAEGGADALVAVDRTDGRLADPAGRGRRSEAPAPNQNHLQLRANPPEWVYSYAPLTLPDGTPGAPPAPGKAGYAMRLHDNQARRSGPPTPARRPFTPHHQRPVLMVPEFHDFPSTAITVEFWMQSVDTCRPGVPFSYAHGRYQQEDNSFLVLNYNS